MKISAILLKNYRQFRNFYLPLVDENGEPLDKVCFIGANATGKSTLLALMARFLEFGAPLFLEQTPTAPDIPWSNGGHAILGLKVQVENASYYVVNVEHHGISVFPAKVETMPDWRDLWDVDTGKNGAESLSRLNADVKLPYDQIFAQIRLQPNGSNLAIYAPPDAASPLRNGDLPTTTLSDALELFKNLPAFHTVSYEHTEGFWNFLIYQIKKRESDYQEYLNSTEVQNISVSRARKKFDAENPEILSALACQWNLILERAGLEFATAAAKIPVQLSDNLEAYIRLKSTQKTLPYDHLSTGIRNFIFRFGHIFALYFNRHIERGFLLLDEPESSLFPDLLYDLIDRYVSIVQNTQMFVATHSPLIASQFSAVERIVLEFDQDGYVNWQRGISPEGDDPNDLLLHDFAVRSLYGPKGIEQWRHYLKLRQEIAGANDPTVKKELLSEYTRIGNAYNFASNEIPE
ncbi:MAG: AAA family ATPase [Caldilineaceae bacterium]